jgi:2,4-dienoyl-CoA reductase-like NADH-dependent reductase (Old Yellow Enzyme family)
MYNLPMTGNVTSGGIQFPSQTDIEAGKSEREAIAKGSAAQIVQLQGSAMSAANAKSMADEAISLANSNPNAFKLLQNADVKNAVQDMVNAALEAAKSQGAGDSAGLTA